MAPHQRCRAAPGSAESYHDWIAHRAQSLRPVLVVADGVAAVEAVARETGFVTQCLARPTERYVVLGRQLAASEPL
jgi:hypothetical protein